MEEGYISEFIFFLYLIVVAPRNGGVGKCGCIALPFSSAELQVHEWSGVSLRPIFPFR